MSITKANLTVTEFSCDEIESDTKESGTIFLSISRDCDLMLRHPSHTPEEWAEEVRALRKLSALALDTAGDIEAKPQRETAVNAGMLLLLLPAFLVRWAGELPGGKTLKCRLGLHPCTKWETCTCYCHMGP